MKNPQKIEAICNNLADAKDEIRQAIDTLSEIQPDEMRVTGKGDMVLDLLTIQCELQRVLDMAYSMQTYEANKREAFAIAKGDK